MQIDFEELAHRKAGSVCAAVYYYTSVSLVVCNVCSSFPLSIKMCVCVFK